MSDITYKFIGWNHSEGHDKVWVSFRIGPVAYAAWGRRGGRLQFKKHGSYVAPLNKLESQKKDKGYKEVDEFMLFTVFPSFKEDIEKQLAIDILANRIK